MGYRGNNGCLIALLLMALIGGTPLLIGIFRVFSFFLLFLVVGGWLGSWWIRRNAVRLYTETQSGRHNRFVELLVDLLVRLAEIDGPITRDEVAAIRRFFEQRLGYREEKLIWLRDLIKEARNSTTAVPELCAALAAEYHFQERFIVLQVLQSVAQADGVTTREEAAFIHAVADGLGLGAFTRGFGAQGAQFGGRQRVDQTGEALAELGLEPGADAETIKKTWRTLSKEHHPDRVAHLGEEFRRMAEDRMRKINAAYDTLKDAGLAT